jgi:hypothetical protein
MTETHLTDYLAGKKCQGFDPHPFYSKDGDFVSYYFRNDVCRAERIDNLLTIYLSLETAEEEFVGFKLKGVKQLWRHLGDFGFNVFDGKGKPMLGMLFLAGGFLYATPDALDQYRELAKRTASIPVEVGSGTDSDPSLALSAP